MVEHFKTLTDGDDFVVSIHHHRQIDLGIGMRLSQPQLILSWPRVG